MKQDLGLAGRLAHAFLNSKLTPLFIAASLALGIFAVAIIPREEEPQILVPMLDITTAMPGASPAEVEERVTLPIETLVHQISGVEYVYSTSSPGQSLVIVRFLVGTPQEDALIKVYSKLYSNFDRMPPGVSQPLIKARSIDDVPILALTLWGQGITTAISFAPLLLRCNTTSSRFPMFQRRRSLAAFRARCASSSAPKS